MICDAKTSGQRKSIFYVKKKTFFKVQPDKHAAPEILFKRKNNNKKKSVV